MKKLFHINIFTRNKPVGEPCSIQIETPLARTGQNISAPHISVQACTASLVNRVQSIQIKTMHSYLTRLKHAR